MMRRVTKQQWFKKVEKLFSEKEDGGGFALARFVDRGDDGRPVYLDEENETILQCLHEGKAGVYHLLDDAGKVVSECAIGRTGERENRNTFHADQANHRMVSSVAESWERQVNSLQAGIDKRDEKIDKLEAKIDALREENDGLREQMREQALEADDDPMIEFIKEGLEFVKGQGLKNELMKRINERGVLQRLSPEAQKEIVALLNSGVLQ
jgi:SMC interacting uncharacterized protein involved in chromosome segregation